VVLLWQIVQASLFRLSPQPAYEFRRTLLQLFGAKIGRKVKIRPSARVTYPWKVTIGAHSWIGDEAVLYSLGEIRIGAHTVVSQFCHLCAADHDLKAIDFAIRARPIIIGDEVWLASDVFVAPGVSIGDGAVVGARSSVFRDVPGGVVCMGSPARVREPRKPPGLRSAAEGTQSQN
jgi:putative colanic acid biosynthesis acetyltransferase WcaF